MATTAFLSDVTKKLAERWVASLFTPAFVFWAGGGLVCLQIWGWENTLRATFNSLSDSIKVVTLIFPLIGVAVSGFVIQRFDLAALRFLEGYWPKYLRPLRRQLLTRRDNYFTQQKKHWNHLLDKQEQAPLTSDEAEDLARIDWQLTRQVPTATTTRMPTKLGNILRAAELAPSERYGLNAILCWPHLWMVLPETARTDISTAREDLNTAARLWLWSVLFCGWALLGFCARAEYDGPLLHLLWPLPLGLLSAYFCYQWAINAAENYASLLRAAYDLYRFKLYDALGIKKPENPETEKQRSQALNQYLFRGY